MPRLLVSLALLPWQPLWGSSFPPGSFCHPLACCLDHCALLTSSSSSTSPSTMLLPESLSSLTTQLISSHFSSPIPWSPLPSCVAFRLLTFSSMPLFSSTLTYMGFLVSAYTTGCILWATQSSCFLNPLAGFAHTWSWSLLMPLLKGTEQLLSTFGLWGP